MEWASYDQNHSVHDKMILYLKALLRLGKKFWKATIVCGTRVRFIEDHTSEDAYKMLCKEEELSILLNKADLF